MFRSFKVFAVILALGLGGIVAVSSVAVAGTETVPYVQDQALPVVKIHMVCGTRDSVVEMLDEKYGEVRRGGGLAGPMAIFEIWASEETGGWTILKTTPNGSTCVMAMGESWHDETSELTPVGDPI